MDDDLQHSPKDIIKMVNELKNSNTDVCYGKYQKTSQSNLKNIGSWLNDKLANIVIKKPKNIYMSPFKVISKNLKDKIINYDGPYPYIDGLIFRYTSKISDVEIILKQIRLNPAAPINDPVEINIDPADLKNLRLSGYNRFHYDC